MEVCMSQRAKVGLVFVTCSFLGELPAIGQTLPNLYPFPNRSGLLETYNGNGKPIDLTGPFFQSLGTNGRSCASCHRPAQAWSISAEELKLRFEFTQGRDPIFRPNDGSICSHDIDTSTVGARPIAF
jgi:cytochrome c peroxidase